MVKKVDVRLVDDTDPGSVADETLLFGLDGVSYEIDLATANAEALRQAMGPWISHARRASRWHGGARGRKN